MAVSAVGAEHDIVRVQVGADARGNRLLADISVARAVNQTALMAAGQLLFALPDQLHGAIAGQHLRWGGGGHLDLPAAIPTEPPPFKARLPPSIGISAPVIQLELSEAKNTARPRMSSGRPKRPAGMPLRN